MHPYDSFHLNKKHETSSTYNHNFVHYFMFVPARML
jgi:hypothetical protein